MFWILLAFLVVGFFYPIIGFAAIVCMIGPVFMSVFRGRYWCGHFCPRGNFYDRVISRVSRRKRIPTFLRSKGFRIFMVFFIFAMFGVQMYFAWGDWAAMGKVFWNIILLTTLVGVVLGILYAPRAWCCFCPMGTLSSWVAPRRLQAGFANIHVADSCVLCKRCAKECPMQLKPYEAKGAEVGMLDGDCIKCGVCVGKCPKQSMALK